MFLHFAEEPLIKSEFVNKGHNPFMLQDNTIYIYLYNVYDETGLLFEPSVGFCTHNGVFLM